MTLYPNLQTHFIKYKKYMKATYIMNGNSKQFDLLLRNRFNLIIWIKYKIKLKESKRKYSNLINVTYLSSYEDQAN